MPKKPCSVSPSHHQLILVLALTILICLGINVKIIVSTPNLSWLVGDFF